MSSLRKGTFQIMSCAHSMKIPGSRNVARFPSGSPNLFKIIRVAKLNSPHILFLQRPLNTR